LKTDINRRPEPLRAGGFSHLKARPIQKMNFGQFFNQTIAILVNFSYIKLRYNFADGSTFDAEPSADYFMPHLFQTCAISTTLTAIRRFPK